MGRFVSDTCGVDMTQDAFGIKTGGTKDCVRGVAIGCRKRCHVC